MIRTIALALALCAIAALGSAPAAFAANPAASAANPLVIPISNSADLSLTIETDPGLGEWNALPAAGLDGGWTAESSEGYRVEVAPSEDGVFSVEVSRADASAFTIDNFQARVTLPIDGIVAQWDTQVPPFGTLFRRVPELEFKINVKPNLGLPLVILVDHYGNNKLAAGFVDQAQCYEISGERDGYDYALTLRFTKGDHTPPADKFTSALYLNQAPDYWFESLQTFTDVVDTASGYQPKPIPDGAYDPVYSTCYPYSDKINEDIVWRNAVEASKLGIKQILIDAGWSIDLGWADSTGDLGDYLPSKTKFPDFAGLIERIHDELEMRVVLWASPTWIGKQSASFETMKDYRVKWPDGDYDRNLCPRTPQARQHLADRFSNLAKQYKIDGLWVDFLDTCPSVCDAPHQHDILDFGEALDVLLEDIYQSVAKSNPDATVEYRVPYSNLFVKPHANVFETTDAPLDFNANRLMGISVRGFSKGLVAKGDPAYWQKDVHCETVARFCMTSIFLGVPAFSVDFINMDESRKTQIGKWIAFYNEHREDLLTGTFTPFGESFHNPDLKIVADDKAFVYLITQKSRVIPIEKPVDELYILNANPSNHGQLRVFVEGLPDGTYTGYYLDCSLHGDRQETFSSKNGRMKLHTDMPTGGLLKLVRQ